MCFLHTLPSSHLLVLFHQKKLHLLSLDVVSTKIQRKRRRVTKCVLTYIESASFKLRFFLHLHISFFASFHQIVWCADPNVSTKRVVCSSFDAAPGMRTETAISAALCACMYDSFR